jgi:hypothetical protein
MNTGQQAKFNNSINNPIGGFTCPVFPATGFFIAQKEV